MEQLKLLQDVSEYNGLGVIDNKSEIIELKNTYSQFDPESVWVSTKLITSNVIIILYPDSSDVSDTSTDLISALGSSFWIAHLTRCSIVDVVASVGNSNNSSLTCPCKSGSNGISYGNIVPICVRHRFTACSFDRKVKSPVIGCGKVIMKKSKIWILKMSTK